MPGHRLVGEPRESGRMGRQSVAVVGIEQVGLTPDIVPVEVRRHHQTILLCPR